MAITITYTKPVNASVGPVSQICATYVPANAACDNAAFDGTYYDTNVYGMGACMTPEEFFNSQIAHPGLVAALKAAMRLAGSAYTWANATADDIQYAQELSATKALEDQGFVIAVSE